MTAHTTRYVSALLLWLALMGQLVAAPQAKLWPKWATHEDSSVRSVDHAAWDAFLTGYLEQSADGINRVAYGRVGDADKAALAEYVSSLGAVPVSTLNRAEQFAYWINLYNALTVKVVLDNYPVDSIRQIKPWFFSLGPWSTKRVQVESDSLSLDDIEHRILRPIWRDPRIHYAVNCAALGCPNLQPTAFTAANAEHMLETAAREFINHPRAVTFDRGELVVSSIFVWFKEDFGNTDREVIQHLAEYAEGDLAVRLAGAERIGDDQYDWQLNDSNR